jgi:hypothetical protein
MIIDSHIRTLLLRGVVYSHGENGEALDFSSIEELQAIWAKVGTKLTSEHVENNPGTRPWAWWKWSRTEALPEPSFTWQLSDAGRVGGISRRNREAPSGHVQREYLASHNLLSAEEERALAADDARWAAIGK